MALKSKGNKNRSADRDYYENSHVEHNEVHVHHDLQKKWTPHLISCPHCFARVSFQAATCPACHAPFEKQRQAKAAKLEEIARLQRTILALLSIAVAIALSMVFLKPDELIAGLIGMVSSVALVVCLAGAVVAWVRLKLL